MVFYKNKRYKRKIRPVFNIKLYLMMLFVVLGTAVVYFNVMSNYLSEIFNCSVNINNTDYTYITNRLSEYKNNIELNKINNEAHNAVSELYDTNVDADNESLDTAINTSNVPEGHSFKSFTYYTSLSQHSPQGELQQQAYTDENGLRKVGDYYCAALGSYYGTTIGDKYVVTLSTGKTFKMILCDAKSDAHTDANHQYTVRNGCVSEFYVDRDRLNSMAKSSGNISSIPGFEGDVVSIIKE